MTTPRHFGSSTIVQGTARHHRSCVTLFMCNIVPVGDAIPVSDVPVGTAFPARDAATFTVSTRSLPCVRHFKSFDTVSQSAEPFPSCALCYPVCVDFFLLGIVIPWLLLSRYSFLGVACHLCLLHFFVVWGTLL